MHVVVLHAYVGWLPRGRGMNLMASVADRGSLGDDGRSTWPRGTSGKARVGSRWGTIVVVDSSRWIRDTSVYARESGVCTQFFFPAFWQFGLIGLEKMGLLAGQGGCGLRDEPIFFTEVNPIFIKQTRNRYKVAGDTCLQKKDLK